MQGGISVTIEVGHTILWVENWLLEGKNGSRLTPWMPCYPSELTSFWTGGGEPTAYMLQGTVGYHSKLSKACYHWTKLLAVDPSSRWDGDSREIFWAARPHDVTHLAAASWELVVISMASWTLRCRASRVRWSTGSTDCTSTLLTTSPFCGKKARSLALGRAKPSEPLVSDGSKPKTAARMMRAEFLWKSSKVTEATAPRTRDAMALQASPTKSGTEKSLATSCGSFRLLSSKCL